MLLVCLSDKAKIALFQNYRISIWIEDPQEEQRGRQRSKNPTPGTTRMCNPWGWPEGEDGQAWN